MYQFLVNNGSNASRKETVTVLSVRCSGSLEFRYIQRPRFANAPELLLSGRIIIIIETREDDALRHRVADSKETLLCFVEYL